MPIPPPVLSVVANAVSGQQDQQNQKRQNAENMKLAEYQYSKDLEQWNRNNAYNDPSQQMSRLKKAGINPQSIAGQPTATGNSGSTQAKFNAPTAQYKAKIQLPEMLNQFAAIQQTQANTNLTNTQAEGQKDKNQIVKLLLERDGIKTEYSGEKARIEDATRKANLSNKIGEGHIQDQTKEYNRSKNKAAKNQTTLGANWQNMIVKEIITGLKGISIPGLSSFNR